tara:strand:+ start:3241 stop:3591 length:351 start_codon:yes stop_codon:yes gene_type:complete
MFDVFFQPNQPLFGFKKIFDLSIVPTTAAVKELWNREDKDYVPIPFDYDEAHARLGAPDEWYWVPHKANNDLWILIKYPLVYREPFWVVKSVRALTYTETLEQKIKELEAQLTDNS